MLYYWWQVLEFFVSSPLKNQTQRIEVDIIEQSNFFVMAARPLRASLNPYVNLSQIEAAVDEDAEDTQASFEELVNDFENLDDDTSTDEKW